MVVDYKAQYYHELNSLRYSSLSAANYSILANEQQMKVKNLWNYSYFHSKAQVGKIKPFLIEKVRMMFVLIHFLFSFWLILFSFRKCNDGADPFPDFEYNRLKALVLLSIGPNLASFIFYCYLVPCSLFQTTFFPDVFVCASYEFCAAAFLLLFRGVNENYNCDCINGYSKLQPHMNFD